MIKKYPVYPDRVRKIPKSFSWIDHRLVSFLLDLDEDPSLKTKLSQAREALMTAIDRKNIDEVKKALGLFRENLEKGLAMISGGKGGSEEIWKVYLGEKR